MDSLSSNGLGKTSVVSERRELESFCAFSATMGLTVSSFKVPDRVAKRLDSGNLGISPLAKRPCGGRGGRIGADAIEGAGDER